MTDGITMAPGLVLPMNVLTQKLAFMGKSGSGKSYAAMRLAEGMLENGAQIVALDPVGIWWSLRVGSNGKGPGFPIRVFGGLHGDVPLEATGGALIAELIVERGISAVLDTSQFESSADQSRFVAAFAERFFFLKKANPSAVHVFIEECQEFVPQQPQGTHENNVLHQVRRMVKIGRNYGIGDSLISQRPQAVSKEVLNMTECMFALQMTGPHEKNAIKAWVQDKGGDLDVMELLPRLEIGQAHVWSPQWLKISKTFHIAKRHTFDASSTPVFGEAKRAEVRPLDDKDLAELREAMAATIEKAKANDPDELRARIGDLERELEGMHEQNTEVAPADIESLKAEWRNAELIPFADAMREKIRMLNEPFQDMEEAASDVRAMIASALAEIDTMGLFADVRQAAPAPVRMAAPRPERPVSKESLPTGPPASARDDVSRDKIANGTMPPMRRAFLTALAQHPQGLTKALILMHADYRSSGSTSTEFAALLRDGLMFVESGACRITDAGRAALGPFQRLPVGRERLKLLIGSDKLEPFERKVLSFLGATPTASYTKAQVLEGAGYKSSGSTSSGFARLSKFGYMEKDGAKVRLSKNLR